jgi:hypothetical protein
MAGIERVPLLDASLELTQHLQHLQHLTPVERSELAGIDLPVAITKAGPLELGGLLEQHQAFSGMVLDGIVMNSRRIGEQTGIQLLGPGDVLVPPRELSRSWLATPILSPARETTCPRQDVGEHAATLWRHVEHDADGGAEIRRQTPHHLQQNLDPPAEAPITTRSRRPPECAWSHPLPHRRA